MSEILSFLSEVFSKEVTFFLKGLTRDEANPILLRNPTSGVAKQLVCLIFCWAALKYLAVQVDWQTVGLFVEILIHTCVKIISLRWLSYHFYSKFDLTVTQYMHDPLDLKVQCFQSDCCCWHCSN
jgi:hypothetical protein